MAAARLLPHPVLPQVKECDFAAKKAALAAVLEIVLAKKPLALPLELLEFVTAKKI